MPNHLATKMSRCSKQASGGCVGGCRVDFGVWDGRGCDISICAESGRCFARSSTAMWQDAQLFANLSKSEEPNGSQRVGNRTLEHWEVSDCNWLVAT